MCVPASTTVAKGIGGKKWCSDLSSGFKRHLIVLNSRLQKMHQHRQHRLRKTTHCMFLILVTLNVGPCKGMFCLNGNFRAATVQLLNIMRLLFGTTWKVSCKAENCVVETVMTYPIFA